MVYYRSFNINSSVHGYVDYDYVGDIDKRKNVIEYLFMLSSGAISWKVTLQSTITLSITEIEYMETTESAKEAICLRSLVDNLSLKQKITVIYCDSQSMIHFTKYQMHHERTKHIDLRYHFIQEIVSQGAFMMKKTSIFDNPTYTMVKN